jgi:predicted RecB family nuclease
VIPHCEPSTLTLPDGRIIQAVPDSHSAWEFFHDSVIANHQPIYHWTKFDTGNLKKLGPSWVHDALNDRFHDLYQSFAQSIQLPTHSNSLKVVAPFAGFHWRAPSELAYRMDGLWTFPSDGTGVAFGGCLSVSNR